MFNPDTHQPCSCPAWQAHAADLPSGSADTPPLAYCPWCGARLLPKRQPATTAAIPAADTADDDDDPPTPVLQLMVRLEEIEPPIWRRIQVYQHITFYELHLTLQAVMGWLHSHLHSFSVHDVLITDTETLLAIGVVGHDHESARLIDFSLVPGGTRFEYEYDFGDSWKHEIIVEQMLPAGVDDRLPRCIEGARACPPEDVGGSWGYAHFLEVIADPAAEDHDHFMAWSGGDHDPEAFDLDVVNRRLRDGYVWQQYEITPPLAVNPYCTAAAVPHWEALPPADRHAALSQVLCRDCITLTTIVDYRVRFLKGSLIIEGACAHCGEPLKTTLALDA